MAGNETIALVQRAKRGDAHARNDLVARYYQVWIDRFHGDLGTTIRALHSTQDIVQSALIDAMRDIGALRNEGAFFAWVTMIIKHKIAQKRRKVTRRNRGGRDVRLGSLGGGRTSGDGADILADPDSPRAEIEFEDLDEYVHITENILELFPRYPRQMAAVCLSYLWQKSIDEVREQLGGVSRRSVSYWLRQGLELLNSGQSDE